MTANAFAISRRLVERGVDKGTAEAVAEELVTHADENLATKADIAEIKGYVLALTIQVRVSIGLSIGLYIALAAFLLGKL